MFPELANMLRCKVPQNVMLDNFDRVIYLSKITAPNGDLTGVIVLGRGHGEARSSYRKYRIKELLLKLNVGSFAFIL